MPFSFSPVDASTIQRGDGVVITYQGALPLTVDVYVDDTGSEQLALSHAFGETDIHYGGYSIEFDTSKWPTAYYITVRSPFGWMRSDSVSIRVEGDISGGGPESGTASYTVQGDMLGYSEPSMLDDALDLLLVQFQGKPDIEAWLASYVKEADKLRQVAYQLTFARILDLATGHRLDQLGAIAKVGRVGDSDTDYRRKIKAKFLIHASDGTLNELIEILKLLLDLPNYDIAADQYFPETLYLRARNFAFPDNADQVGSLLRLAGAAGYNIQFIYSPTESSDDDIFRFSDVASATEPGASHGFGSGIFTGAA